MTDYMFIIKKQNQENHLATQAKELLTALTLFFIPYLLLIIAKLIS